MIRKPDFKAMAAIAALAVCTGITAPAFAEFDLVVEQTASASTINVGDTVIVTATFRNNGPEVSPTSNFRFYAPEQFEVLSATIGTIEVLPGVPESATAVSLPQTQLGSGESTSTVVVLRALEGGIWETVTEATYAPLDPPQETNFNNNRNRIRTIVMGGVPIYDLALSYGTSTVNVQPGGLLSIDFSVRNLGPENCTSIFVNMPTEPFQSAGFRFGDLSLLTIQDAGSWNFTEEYNSLMGSLPFLAAGDSTTFTLIFKVLDAPANDRVLHQAVVYSDSGADLNEGNDRQYILIPLTLTNDNSGTDLEITRSMPAEVAMDQPFTFSLQAVNRGPNPTPNAFIGNLVPGNLRVVAAAGDKGSASVLGNYVKLEDAPLAVGETATLQVTVAPNALGQAQILAGATSDGFDPVLNNNVTAAITEITPDGPGVVQPPTCVNTSDLVSNLVQVRRRGKFNKKQGQWQYKVQAKVEISNVGTSCSTKSPVWFYLSNNVVLDASDILIGGKNVGKICPGKKSKKLSFKAKLPLGLDPVNYYIIAVADGENVLAECDETNNWSVNY